MVKSSMVKSTSRRTKSKKASARPAPLRKAAVAKSAALPKRPAVARAPANAPARATKPPAKNANSAAKSKWVYSFGNGKAEGRPGMRDLLGGKGAGLAEMANLGLPVPPGFTITTAVCTHYYASGK